MEWKAKTTSIKYFDRNLIKKTLFQKVVEFLIECNKTTRSSFPFLNCKIKRFTEKEIKSSSEE